MKTYSFVILTYNSRKTIEKCIQSVISATKDIEREIIVVDNASSDDTVSFVAETFGDKVILIESLENKGFSGGVNLGFKRATGDYCVLLNPDADIVSIDFKAVEKQFSHGKLGVLAAKVMWPDGRLQPSFGSFPNALNLFLYFLRLQRFLPGGFLIYDNVWNKRYYRWSKRVDWCSGAFMVIPRKVLKMVDYFDEEYFLYVEDVDFCKRVARKGFIVAVDPEIEISHVLQASVKEDPMKNWSYQVDGFNRYFERYKGYSIMWLMRLMSFLKKRKL